MNSIVGTWRLVAEAAWDGSGPRPTLFGPVPLGIVTFTSAGRMIVAISDGRPGPIGGPRAYASYCGAYTFDGTRLVTEVDGATNDRVREPQIRDARFEGAGLFLRFKDAGDVTRELTWERLG